MKKLLALLLLIPCTLSLYAQLPDGTTAPNFTATDTDGNEWNLYDVLASGRSVVLELATTWNGTAWDYHQNGALESFHLNYGPDGTGEVVVLMIESDDDTTGEDLAGTGPNTEGDWLEAITYPIIDDGEFIANLFQSYAYPDIILICPNRILQHMGRIAAFSLYQSSQDCLVPFGENNAGILNYSGFEGDFCGEVSFEPEVVLQNLGAEPLTAAELELYLNGNLSDTRQWTGYLELYAREEIEFEEVTLTEFTDIQILITSVNDTLDEGPENDSTLTTVTPGPTTDQNFVYLQVETDDYPAETYWEIRNANGTVFHAGGNPGVFTGEVLEGAYGNPNTVYTLQVPLPADGCYEFVIYDSYGDGICCGYGFGNYQLFNPDNSIILQGGLFDIFYRQPFSLEGSNTIENNATIIAYNGPSGEFCSTLNLEGTVTIQNHGANEINSLELSLSDGIDPPATFTWNGNLSPGAMTDVDLPPQLLISSADLTLSILQANELPDAVDIDNSVEITLTRRLTTFDTLDLLIQTDNWGYEIYWQMMASDGEIVAFGGNEQVGPDGGGLRQAAPGQPGAYADNANIEEMIVLPAGENDCYELLIVDDWGDGLGSTGFFRLADPLDNVLLYEFPTGSYDSYLVDAELTPNATVEPTPVKLFMLSPNPATDFLHVAFSTSENTRAEMTLINALGKIMYTRGRQHFAAGEHQLEIDVSGFSPGIYYCKMMVGKYISVGKFVVSAE